MRLIVIDPRRVGLASKADLWLKVRPGPTARSPSASPTS
jgi:anaerobic selenocysteine-containing dehydrogenase